MDIFCFVLDGRVPDEGAAVELGMAYAQRHLDQGGKILVGLEADQRAAFLGVKLNPMLEAALARLFKDDDALLDILRGL